MSRQLATLLFAVFVACSATDGRLVSTDPVSAEGIEFADGTTDTIRLLGVDTLETIISPP